MTTTIRRITKWADIDTTKHYQLYDNMTPAEAAEKFERRYGIKPAEVLVYGEFAYIEQTPLAALTGRR